MSSVSKCDTNTSMGLLPHFSWYWQTQVLKITAAWEVIHMPDMAEWQNLEGENQKHSCSPRTTSCLRHEMFLPWSVQIVQTYSMPNTHLGLDSHSSLKSITKFLTWHRTWLKLFQNCIPVQNFVGFSVFS